MDSLQDCYTLSNGVKIPCIGFGTWKTPDGDVAVDSVKEAIKAGYRHIDTASIYGNEESVGIAIKESGIPREELFITSKVWNTDRGYNETLKAFNETIRKLDLEYLNLYLIHWPRPSAFRDTYKEVNKETWRALEELYTAGKIKAIGVSNFIPRHLEELMETATITPMVNQIEFHPGLNQNEILEFCKKHNILVEGWSPLANGNIFNVEEMNIVANKYDKTIAQICIAWGLQKGVLPLPKSVTPERIQSNANVFDFELSEDDISYIDNIVLGRIGPDPDNTKF